MEQKCSIGIFQILNWILKKLKKRFVTKGSGYLIPVSVFSASSLSPMEAVVVYLKDEFSLSYHKVAMLLKRDDRTIWTVYNRARKKLIRLG